MTMPIARFIFAAFFAGITAPAIVTASETQSATVQAVNPTTTQAVAQNTAGDPAIAWIAALNDPDPVARDRAAEQLVKGGRASLWALGQAARSDLPEVQYRARGLLAQIPWDLPDDPYSIRWLIGNFGAHELEHRQSIVDRLAAMHGNDRPAAWRALGRIFMNDPDESVQWQIACLALQQVCSSRK